jgi:hypothetical protein
MNRPGWAQIRVYSRPFAVKDCLCPPSAILQKISGLRLVFKGGTPNGAGWVSSVFILPWEAVDSSIEDSRFPVYIERNIMLGTVLLVLLILMLLGAIPTWPHSKNWGYGPSGGVGLILVILVVLLLSGRI